MIEFGRVDPTPLVTHHLYGLDKVEEALYLMRDKPADLVKVMVHCE
jgi:threonine dehydrogenase-like Zn-dependent dehydrogenase